LTSNSFDGSTTRFANVVKIWTVADWSTPGTGRSQNCATSRVGALFGVLFVGAALQVLVLFFIAAKKQVSQCRFVHRVKAILPSSVSLRAKMKILIGFYQGFNTSKGAQSDDVAFFFRTAARTCFYLALCATAPGGSQAGGLNHFDHVQDSYYTYGLLSHGYYYDATAEYDQRSARDETHGEFVLQSHLGGIYGDYYDWYNYGDYYDWYYYDNYYRRRAATDVVTGTGSREWARAAAGGARGREGRARKEAGAGAGAGAEAEHDSSAALAAAAAAASRPGPGPGPGPRPEAPPQALWPGPRG